MNALRTALTAADLPETSAELSSQAIETAVPHGVPLDVVNDIKVHGKIHLLASMRNGLSLSRLSVVNAKYPFP